MISSAEPSGRGETLRTRQPSIKRNYFYRLIYELLLLITPFITTPYIARVLGPDGVGIYSYTASVMAYFTLFAALGTASYGAREIARNRDDPAASAKLFWEIELITVMSSLICLAGWLAVIFTASDYRPYFIALTPVIFAAMFDIAWFYTGHEQIVYSIPLNILFKTVGVVLLFVFVKEKSDLVKFAAIHALALCAGNLSMWLFLPRLLVKVDWRSLSFSRHIRESLVYFIPTIAASVYTVLDKTLIHAITGDVFQNGYYEQASKIVNILKTFVFVSVNAVMSARISYLFAEGKYAEIHRRIGRSMDFILLLGFGCVFGVIGVAENFVPLFFGEGYDGVIPLLYMMSGLILIVGVSNCLGSHYYTPGGKRKRSAVYILIGAGVNLCLNFLMIPAAGAAGAAAASVIAELAITGLYVKSSDGYLTAPQIWRYSRKRLIAGSVMCFAALMIGRANISNRIFLLAVQVLTGAAIYAAVLFALKDAMLFELFDMGMGFLRRIGSKLRGC